MANGRETLAEMETRHAAERTAQAFDQTVANAGKADAEAHIIGATKTLAFGIAVGVETIDSQYVTLTTPTNKTGVDAALWALIVDNLRNEKYPSIIGTGTVRVRKDRAAGVIDKIEAALP